MEPGTTVILIDGDSRRRAAISHSLASSGLHIEPFENVQELGSRRPRAAIILVQDDGPVVRELIQTIAGKGEWLPVIAFAESPEPSRIVEAILEGAVDYQVWPFTLDSLSASFEKVRERARTLGNGRIRAAAARGRVERLTRREREVLSGVASGLSNRRIGEKLSISPRTVEIHRANMLTKIGATHTSEAIRIAIEAAIVD